MDIVSVKRLFESYVRCRRCQADATAAALMRMFTYGKTSDALITCGGRDAQWHRYVDASA